MDEPVSGKVAMITGEMNGSGRVCAATLLRAGADVVIADLDTVQPDTVIAEISTDTGRQVKNIETDVSDPAQCQRLVQQASSHFGHVDILADCAGLIVQQPVLNRNFMTPF